MHGGPEPQGQDTEHIDDEQGEMALGSACFGVQDTVAVAPANEGLKSKSYSPMCA